MRVLLALSLVVFIFGSVACSQYVAYENQTVFSTPFGQITKGDSMKQVVQVLGKPEKVSHYKRKEVWQYNSTKAGKISVYFEKGNVVDIQSLDRPQKACSCCAG